MTTGGGVTGGGVGLTTEGGRFTTGGGGLTTGGGGGGVTIGGESRVGGVGDGAGGVGGAGKATTTQLEDGELAPLGHDLMTSCVFVSLPVLLMCHSSLAMQPG